MLLGSLTSLLGLAESARFSGAQDVYTGRALSRYERRQFIHLLLSQRLVHSQRERRTRFLVVLFEAPRWTNKSPHPACQGLSRLTIPSEQALTTQPIVREVQNLQRREASK